MQPEVDTLHPMALRPLPIDPAASNGMYLRYLAALDALSQTLVSYVIPLYIERRGIYEQVGTGFIVRFVSRHYLVTAAHVLDIQKESPLFVYTSPREIRRIDGISRSTVHEGGRQVDMLDVGVVKLSNSASPPYPGVRKVAMEINMLAPGLQRHAATYLLLGFPSTKNRLNRVTRDVVSKGFAWEGRSASPEIYQKIGISEEHHLALAFDRKVGLRADGSPVDFPKPQGMSGAPIWLLHRDEDMGLKEFVVTAIAHTHKERHGAIVCTDIRVACELIGVLATDPY